MMFVLPFITVLFFSPASVKQMLCFIYLHNPDYKTIHSFHSLIHSFRLLKFANICVFFSFIYTYIYIVYVKSLVWVWFITSTHHEWELCKLSFTFLFIFYFAATVVCFFCVSPVRLFDCLMKINFTCKYLHFLHIKTINMSTFRLLNN